MGSFFFFPCSQAAKYIYLFKVFSKVQKCIKCVFSFVCPVVYTLGINKYIEAGAPPECLLRGGKMAKMSH